MRYLIVRMSSLGDVVHTLPVAAAIKSMDSEAEIVWAASRHYAPLVRLCPHVDQTVVMKKSFWKNVPLVKSLGRFDVALDMQGLFKTGWITLHADAAKKLGYHWQREGSGLFSSPVKPDPTSHHVVDQYLDVVRALGAQVTKADFSLKPDEPEAEKMTALLDELGRDRSRPLVLVNPSSARSVKRWAPASMAHAVRILDEAGFQVGFIGTASDEWAFKEVEAEGLPVVLSLLGRTTVSELVALISLAQAHVGGDTGSTHIAAALGIPAYSVYTATRPERSCPYGQIHRCQTTDPIELTDLMKRELCWPAFP